MVVESVRCRQFVGRVDELEVLENARKSLAQSSGSFVLISGEAGIGKTRLLTEFLERLERGRARNVVNCECLYRGQQPMGPLRAFLRALVPGVDLERLGPTVLGALVQTIPDRLPPRVVEAHGGAVLEKDRLFAAVLELLDVVCAKRATVLTVEDIHWADGSTLEFLSYVAHRMKSMRLLIVATCRSEELDAGEELLSSLSPLLRESTLRHVTLEPLARPEIRAVVDGAAAGRGDLPEKVVLDIERLSEGNPFFAEELVNVYIDRATVRDVPLGLPLSIRASIAARLNGLSADERNVIKHAAVLGQRFDPNVLAVVMNRRPQEVFPALARAHELNLLVDDGGRRSCRFRHALTRQTVYDELPAFEARELHARILLTFETGALAGDHLEELAYHAWESGNAPKCLYYNERAGNATFELRALPEALTCFERALEAAHDPDDRARLFERIGVIDRLHGHYERAIAAFETALGMRLERGEFDAAALLATSVLGQRYNVGDDAALAGARRFLSEFGARLSDGSRNHLLVSCARVASAQTGVPSAAEFLDRVVDPVDLPPAVRKNFLIVQLMRHSFFNDAPAWKRAAAEVGELLRALSPEAVVEVESALALTGIYLAQNAVVERSLARAARVESAWGFRGLRVYAVAVEAAYLFQRGKLSQSTSRMEEVLANADVTPAVLVALPIAAYAATASGDESLWRKFDEDHVRRARENPNEPDSIALLGAVGGLLVARGDDDAGRALIRCALGSLERAIPEAMYLLIDAAGVLPEGEQDRAVRLAREASRNGNDVALATEGLVLALRAARFGGAAEACDYGRQAAARYDALGWPLLAARALETAGDVAAARELYARCGAAACVRRLGFAPATSPNDAFHALSVRENQIVALLAQGHTNAEIAKTLNIAGKTVEKHVSSVFGKLGLRSRAQVAALVAAAGRRAI
ncbi:MAG TPA: AAA family ATPase [Candidatus Tumulicola sp.]